jgi:predicted RNase H-like nuclease (RuvC/YqgF family)
MFEKIFNEIFGDIDWKEVADKMSEITENEDEKDSSYFYKVEEKYDNGQHVSHIEKEVKDGKVIKDINCSMNIEDKSNKNKEDVYKKCSYEDKCMEYETVIEKLEKELRDKDKTIKKLQKENDEIKDKIKEYLQNIHSLLLK